jgi:hypothetical protein
MEQDTENLKQNFRMHHSQYNINICNKIREIFNTKWLPLYLEKNQLGHYIFEGGAERENVCIFVYVINFFNWYSGGWSPVGSTRHCGHQ